MHFYDYYFMSPKEIKVEEQVNACMFTPHKHTPVLYLHPSLFCSCSFLPVDCSHHLESFPWLFLTSASLCFG